MPSDLEIRIAVESDAGNLRRDVCFALNGFYRRGAIDQDIAKVIGRSAGKWKVDRGAETVESALSGANISPSISKNRSCEFGDTGNVRVLDQF